MPLIRSMLPRLLEPLPSFVDPVRVFFDGDDEAAATFLNLLFSFVASPEEATALVEAAILAGTPSEAIRRLQDDSRPLMRQDSYDQVFPDLIAAEEATTDATTTPVIWTVS